MTFTISTLFDIHDADIVNEYNFWEGDHIHC